VRYTVVNLYQSTLTTCTKQPLIINMYHKQVHQPCTNLYQPQSRVHQPCNKYVPMMHQIHINYDSSRCTNIINYTPHVCATHQLLVSTMYPTCTSTKSPHQFHHPNLICNSVIDLVYMITYLQTFLNFNNKRLAFSSNFTLVSHD
jgi:hypothetical protein